MWHAVYTHSRLPGTVPYIYCLMYMWYLPLLVTCACKLTAELTGPIVRISQEERRRTGRYVAIVVGISLVCLAIYHAWVRKIPVLASLLVPALIMLLYIAWVLYTAARDKKKVNKTLELSLYSYICLVTIHHWLLLYRARLAYEAS